MMFSTFKFCIFSGIAVFVVNIHAADAAPEGSPGSLIANDTAERPEPKAEGETVPCDEFLRRYNETNLPIGTIVRFEGSMVSRTRRDEWNVASPFLLANSADFVTTLQIGYPNRIAYETGNFAFPGNVHSGKRTYKKEKIWVVGDGQTWTELIFGWSRDGRPFRDINKAHIRSPETRPLFVRHMRAGNDFFIWNLDEGHVFEATEPTVSKIDGGWSLEQKGVYTYHGHSRLKLNESFAPVAYKTTRYEGRVELEIQFSDFKELRFGAQKIEQPMKLAYTYSDRDILVQTGECEIHSIEILDTADPEEIFSVTIPKGWEVENHVTDESYIEGQGRIGRMWDEL